MRAFLEAAFGDKKRQFFGGTRRFPKGIPGGTAKESNEVSLNLPACRALRQAGKWPFSARRVASKHALNPKWRLAIITALGLLLAPSLGAQGIFLEAGGAAPFYSLNYTTRLFAAEKISGYFRIGGSVWGEGVAFPIGASLVLGTGDHHPELILAFTPHSEGQRFWSRNESDLFLDLALGLGYRYHPASGPFFAAAGLFPYLRFDPTSTALSEKKTELRFRPGGSVGWYF